MTDDATLRTLAPQLVDETYRLAAGQYVDEVHPKDLVVLHHTVGSWLPHDDWNATRDRVGTAYAIDLKGRVCRYFPDDRWAIHLFRRKAGGESQGVFAANEALALERRSIGIELVSWGVLRELKDGWLYHAYGKRVVRVQDAKAQGLAVRLDEPWREVQWWDGVTEPVWWVPTYPEAQVAATIRLVHYLVATRGIPNVVPLAIARPPRRREEVRQWLEFRGVVTHAMLRGDKTDLAPTFPYGRMAHALRAPGWP